MNSPKRLTRGCLDPWTHVEIGASGSVHPCCMQPALGQISPTDDLEPVDRNSTAFRKLREDLMTGNLSKYCESCHIRPLVPLAAQRRAVRAAGGVPQSEMLRPGTLRSIRIDVNKDCNLRCVYCAVSQPGYQGGRMPVAMVDAVLARVPEDARDLRIDLNGHGETTYHPDWLRIARAALDTGARVTILSNFAKPFDQEEIATLARMSVIQISIDTPDENLLKQLRRRVSLAIILRNMHLVRAYAMQQRLHPAWSISCGVYDRTVPTLRDLAWFAVSAGFDSVVFWNLVKYPDVPEPSMRVRPISDLSKEDRKEATALVADATHILESHGVSVEMTGSFAEMHCGKRVSTQIRYVWQRLLRRLAVTLPH